MGPSRCSTGQIGSRAEHGSVIFLLFLGQLKDPLDDKADLYHGVQGRVQSKGLTCRRRHVAAATGKGLSVSERSVQVRKQNMQVLVSVRITSMHMCEC